MSKFMHYRLADQLCAVDGHTYRVNAVSLSGTGQYNNYIYYVEISLSTSTQLTHEFTSLEFTSYNAAFIDLEANLIKIQISTKAHSAESCTLMLIRLSRRYLSN